LKQGIYEAYELANQKLKNFDKLNFLYSLQGNTAKLEKMQKLTTKMNNPMLGFNVALFLNKHE
jgi:coatomer protein complex subunit alpha (xenin)